MVQRRTRSPRAGKVTHVFFLVRWGVTIVPEVEQRPVVVEAHRLGQSVPPVVVVPVVLILLSWWSGSVCERSLSRSHQTNSYEKSTEYGLW